MQDHELKIQHFIILSALFVTLLGSLLLFERINETTQLSGSTTLVVVDGQGYQEEGQKEDETQIRIVTKANSSIVEDYTS